MVRVVLIVVDVERQRGVFDPCRLVHEIHLFDTMIQLY